TPKLAKRVITLGLVSSFGPVDTPADRQFYSATTTAIYELVLHLPHLAALFFGWTLFRPAIRNWAGFYRDLIQEMSPDDQRILQKNGNEMSPLLRASTLEAFRQGTWHVIQHLRTVFSP